jgi:hypothetical protein
MRLPDYWLRHKYNGFTLADWNAMFEAQGRKCKICGSATSTKGMLNNGKWHTDHKGKTVRGILCGDCNVFLGIYEKHRHLLPAIEEYLSGG